MRHFQQDLAAAPSYAEMESIVHKAAGATDLMLFMRFNFGEVLQ